MSFMDKMKNLVGLDDLEDDEEITQEEIDSYKSKAAAAAASGYREEPQMSTGISPHALVK
ncbi:MAG: hypothetical protein E7220_00285 [Clostridiales bacterium]|nr:hypothetical protein [Clostridiales bacterium]